MEIILVDDGSPDHSGTICEEYASIDERITVIHKENGGQSDAKNVGFLAAHGEYIYYLDSDDYIGKETLERAVTVAEKEKADIVFFGGVAFSDDPDLQLPSVGIEHTYSVSSGAETLIQRWCRKEWMPGGPGHLFAASFIKREELSFYKGIVYEDHLFSSIAYARAERVAQCREAVYYYRIHSDSTMTSKPKVYNLNCFRICVQEIAEEKKHYPEGAKQIEALDTMIRYSAYAYMNLYGELDKVSRRSVSKEMTGAIRTELARVKTIPCGKQKIKYAFPGLWAFAYNTRKKIQGRRWLVRL